MKKLRKLLSLLLCAALLLPLIGCDNEPSVTEPSTAETTAPTTEPAPTEPSAEEIYSEARAALDALTDVTLSITEETTRAVAGQASSASCRTHPSTCAT